jgi:hypothetical protein
MALFMKKDAFLISEYEAPDCGRSKAVKASSYFIEL